MIKGSVELYKGIGDIDRVAQGMVGKHEAVTHQLQNVSTQLKELHDTLHTAMHDSDRAEYQLQQGEQMLAEARKQLPGNHTAVHNDDKLFRSCLSAANQLMHTEAAQQSSSIGSCSSNFQQTNQLGTAESKPQNSKDSCTTVPCSQSGSLGEPQGSDQQTSSASGMIPPEEKDPYQCYQGKMRRTPIKSKERQVAIFRGAFRMLQNPEVQTLQRLEARLDVIEQYRQHLLAIEHEQNNAEDSKRASLITEAPEDSIEHIRALLQQAEENTTWRPKPPTWFLPAHASQVQSSAEAEDSEDFPELEPYESEEEETADTGTAWSSPVVITRTPLKMPTQPEQDNLWALADTAQQLKAGTKRMYEITQVLVMNRELTEVEEDAHQVVREEEPVMRELLLRGEHLYENEVPRQHTVDTMTTMRSNVFTAWNATVQLWEEGKEEWQNAVRQHLSIIIQNSMLCECRRIGQQRLQRPACYIAEDMVAKGGVSITEAVAAVCQVRDTGQPQRIELRDDQIVWVYTDSTGSMKTATTTAHEPPESCSNQEGKAFA